MGDLPPEDTGLLEEFLSQLDAGTLPIAPSQRDHVEITAEIARLALRAAANGGWPEDLAEIAARLAAAPELPPWANGWNEPTQWTDDRVPRTVNEARHKRASEEGQNVARGWIGHPAVAREVEAAKATISALAERLWMYDQQTVTYVTARLLGGTAVWPDGAEWPDPFAGAPAWLRAAAEQLQPAFVGALRTLAKRIAAAGAPLDPEDVAGWLVLAQLAILDFDLSRTPAEIVDELNTWPPGSFDREAATLGHVATHASRHGRNARFQADLAGSAGVVVRRLGPPAIGAPYAAGKKRNAPDTTQRLRLALAELVGLYPSLTPGRLLAPVGGGGDHPALRNLRQKMDWGPERLPDMRTLERNWPKSRP